MIPLSSTGDLHNGPLKPIAASKNPWMGDYMQNKGLDKDFN